MRMSPNELLVNAFRDLREIKPPALPRHLSVKHHLEKQITQLITNLVRISALDCVGDLVRLLDRVGRDRGKRLLLIPRAATLRIA